MAEEGTYEYECMRAELLGIEQPDYDDFLKLKEAEDAARAVEEENVESEELQQSEILNEDLQSTSGKLGELNNILSKTQKKIDSFKFRCGSVTDMIKTRIGGLTSGTSSDNANAENGTGSATPPEEGSDVVAGECQPDSREGNSKPGSGSCPRKSDLSKALDNHVDKLDSMLDQADRAHMSMSEQNKQMKKFLK